MSFICILEKNNFYLHGLLLLPTCLLGIKVPKHFVGLIQMQCSPSFDCNWGKENDLTRCWDHLHFTPTISCFTAREMSQLSTRSHGWGHWNPKLRGMRGGTAPFEPQLTRDMPFKIPPYSLLGQRADRKTINFLGCFMGLCLTTFTNIWSAL